MTAPRPTVEQVTTRDIPDALPEAIVRPRQHVQAVRTQSIAEMGTEGRTALAWEWALTGTRPAPVTLSLAPGHPPSRAQIRAEAEAAPDGSSALPGVPTDFCDQLYETRRVLAWLAGSSDEIPVDEDNRGRLIGARDDYARIDMDIQSVRTRAQNGLTGDGTADRTATLGETGSAQADENHTDVAWLQGVSDLLSWVLGGRPAAPLSNRANGLPAVADLAWEEEAAEELVARCHTADLRGQTDGSHPLEYGEAIQASIRWLRGEVTEPPVDT